MPSHSIRCAPGGNPLARRLVLQGMMLISMVVLICAALPSVFAQVVLSQVYGGGGNTGALFRNDFVELFNRGTNEVDLTGWSVQYASAAGVNWQSAPLSG